MTHHFCVGCLRRIWCRYWKTKGKLHTRLPPFHVSGALKSWVMQKISMEKWTSITSVLQRRPKTKNHGFLRLRVVGLCITLTSHCCSYQFYMDENWAGSWLLNIIIYIPKKSLGLSTKIRHSRVIQNSPTIDPRRSTRRSFHIKDSFPGLPLLLYFQCSSSKAGTCFPHPLVYCNHCSLFPQNRIDLCRGPPDPFVGHHLSL